MKITAIETLVCHAPMRNRIFVKVLTDQPGLFGWGGPVRDSIRLYCHLGGGDMERFYETPVDNAQQFAALAQKAVSDGFPACKPMAVPPTMPIEGRKPVKPASPRSARRSGTISTSWWTATPDHHQPWGCSLLPRRCCRRLVRTVGRAVGRQPSVCNSGFRDLWADGRGVN